MTFIIFVIMYTNNCIIDLNKNNIQLQPFWAVGVVVELLLSNITTCALSQIVSCDFLTKVGGLFLSGYLYLASSFPIFCSKV